MARDVVLELAANLGRFRPLDDRLPKDVWGMIEQLCQPHFARRISDHSLEATCHYLEWLMANLPATTPEPASEQMALGLLVKEGDWSQALLHLSNLGLVLYHAARLHASPTTLARVCYVNGFIRARMGLERPALALWWKAAEALKQCTDPGLRADCLAQIATYYERRKLHGKAWNYISAIIPLAEQLSPTLRVRIWERAARCLKTLHRYEDAARYYELIATIPQAAKIPDRSGMKTITVSKTPDPIERPMYTSLQDWARGAAFGARAVSQGEFAQASYSTYFNLRPGGPLSFNVVTPYGAQCYLTSSYHELYDFLQRLVRQVATTRRSLAWRSSANSYLRGWAPLFEALVETALQVLLPHRALEGLETLRATILLQRLAMAIGPCPAGVSVNDWSRLEVLLNRYRQTVEEEESNSEPGSPFTSGMNIEELENAIRSLAGEIRKKRPEIAPTMALFCGPHGLPGPERFEGLSAGTRIVEYFCTESRGGCWIINPNRPDRPDWIDLPGLSKVTATSVAEEVVTALTAWKAARSRSMRERQSFGSAVHDSFARSKAAIEVAVQFVRKTALGPLLRQLTAEGATHLVVIPHQALHMLPFHAALEQDQPVVTYAPSLTVLSRLRRPSRTALKRSVVVADSVPECPAEQCQYRGQCWRLPAARLEGRYVQNMLQTTGLVVNAAEGATATVEWFEQSLSEAGFLHLATHAVFNAEDPGSSGILFGTGPPVIGTDLDDLPYIAHDGRLAVPGVPACSQLWTLRRLWKRVDLSSCQLAFLGGCETSVVHWDDALEEFLGIAGGFLQAGVPTVIGSLWEISDLATLIKTRRFYRNLLAGKNGPADALFEAQSWLRMVTTEELLNKEADLILDCYALEFVESPQSMEHALAALLGHLPAANSTPFGHPFFWAPFRCVGLP